MKKLAIVTGLIFISWTLVAQSNYNEAIQQGDDAQKRADYPTAINKYFAAEAFDTSKKEIVRAKVNEVFTKVNNLRKEAEEARKEAEIQKTEAESAKIETEKALQQANKLINAFYFYDDKFALAYGPRESENVFYYIDKNGDAIERLGYWKEAKQFTYEGVAETTNDKNVMYLLDTLGMTYTYSDKSAALDTNIQALNLSNQRLSNLPVERDSIININYLNLRNNDLKEFPVEINNLPNLRWLNLFNNYLSDLPAEIGNLPNITFLNLAANFLSTIPPEIGNLTNLLVLHLYDNELSAIPPEIGNLTNLSTLFLHDNELSAIPTEIGNLTKLTRLDLDDNLISAIPPEIGNLTNLSTLYLYDNELSAIPPEIGNLTNLTDLRLHENQLSVIPSEIGNLTNLSILNLYNNQLNEIPPEIGNLTNLTDLRLSENQLNILPLEIGKLKNLEKIWLSGNPLSDLSSDFLQLDHFPVLKSIGDVYYEQKHYEKAEKYLARCREICEELAKNNPNDYPKDLHDVLSTLSLIYHGLGNYRSAIQCRNECNDLLLKHKEQIDYKPSLVQNLGGLSFYYLFTQEYTQSEQSARQALEIDDTQAWIKTNLAHALLFQNRFSEAEKIYKELSQTIYQNDKTFTPTLLQDFDDLEKADVIPEDHKAEVQLIRKKLQCQDGSLTDLDNKTAINQTINGFLTLVNNTGYTIIEAYISLSIDSNWGLNRLVIEEPLKDGQSVSLQLIDEEGLYDIKLVDEDNDSYMKFNVLILPDSRIVFTIDDIDF